MKNITLLDKAVMEGCTSLDDTELAALIAGIEHDVMTEIMASGYTLPELFKTNPFEGTDPEIEWFVRLEANTVLKNRIKRIKEAFGRGAA